MQQTSNRPGAWLRRSIRRVQVVASASILGLGALWAAEPGAEPVAKGSRTDVEKVAGTDPDRCIASGVGREMCRWKLAGALYRSNAATPAEKPGGVYLLCDRPLDPDSEEKSSCSVHDRTPGARDLPAVSATPGETAENPLDGAETLSDLSRLMGDIPDSCSAGPGIQACVWSVSELAAKRLEIDDVAAVYDFELSCALPLDGHERGRDSCILRTIE
jgi:hypothetical protein